MATSPIHIPDSLYVPDILVGKIGGENAVDVVTNVDQMHRRIDEYKMQAVAISAVRSSDPADERNFRYPDLPAMIERLAPERKNKVSGVNTTTHLVAIGLALKEGDKETARRIADSVTLYHQHIVEGTASPDRRLSASRRMEWVDSSVGPVFTGSDPHSLQSLIARATPGTIHQRGVDWVVDDKDGTQSITGVGEEAALRLYQDQFVQRGLSVGSIDANTAELQKAFALEQPELTRHLCAAISAQLQELLSANNRVILAPGYLPGVGSESGYSEKTMAIIAAAAQMANKGRVAAEIQKQSPILSADPRRLSSARHVEYMTYPFALEVFGATRGADGGAVHPEAVKLMASQNIPIVVTGTNGDKTLISGAKINKTGVEIVGVRNGATVVEISCPGMVGERGFAGTIMNFFAEHGLSVEHLATSETSVTVTFNDAVDEQMFRDLVARLQKEKNTSAEYRTFQKSSMIYLLGHNVHTPDVLIRMGSALKAEGIQPRMLTQSSNAHSIVLVVDGNDSEAALRSLHEYCVERP